MSLKIVFFDLKKKSVETYKNILQNKMKNASFVHTDFDTLIKTNSKINAIVLPINSYGIVIEDTNINKNINKILDDAKLNIKKKINDVGIQDNNGIKYLPVGKCEIMLKDNMFLFVAPITMCPTKIKVGNTNAFQAFYAILESLAVLKKWGQNIVLACPCLDTNIGQINSCDSANQVLDAWNQIMITK
jgi:uncharacterized protein (UPF0147 family)